jgi:DNA invertase Pin-like site-specific DNA recombinase
VIGYLRVSTRQQGDSGAGLAAQRATIEAAHTVTEWYEDIESGSGKKLPGRDQAIAACIRTGRPLVAAKLDRLTRSAVDFYELNEQARKHGFALVILDVGMDTSTAMGEAMAGIAAVFAQLERRRISDRTREALLARRQAGMVFAGRPTLEAHVKAFVKDISMEFRPAQVWRAVQHDPAMPVSEASIYRLARS